MFLSLLKKSDDNTDDDNGANGNNIYHQKKGQRNYQNKTSLKSKINFMAKVAKMQRVLREERESILKIKAYNNNKLPQGMLLSGKIAIKNFLECKQFDAVNEMIPKTYFK